jgi:hypothetical protein
MKRQLTASAVLAAGIFAVPLPSAPASAASAWAAAASVSASAPSAWASANLPSFQFRAFDVPGATGTQVNGVNDGDVIEGAFTDASGQHGFVDGPGGLARFDYPGTDGVTQAFAIDNSGDVVGVYTDAAGADHGFLRSSNGTVTALASPPGAGSGQGQGTFPTGITDRGVIVGYYVGTDGVAHGYAQGPGGRFTVIDAPGAGGAAGQGTFIFSVSDRGIICGGYVNSGNVEFGFVDSHGQFTSIDDPATPQTAAGGTDADGFAGGVVVGDYVDQQGIERGYLERDDRFETVADPRGSEGTVITAANGRLTLVGFSITGGGVEHGLIAYPR